MPRYIEKSVADANGLKDMVDLPAALPHNLIPRDFLRMVEDLYDLLHDLNTVLHDKSYDRLEELLDPAGFSGLVSKAAADGIAKFSRALVKNRHHNGYPDLLPRGVYPGDATSHGTLGGLEIKASRYERGWQAHGPRAGWFCVVQFGIDQDEARALQDREPTIVRAVLVAELSGDDWSWQPAGEGRIRSGTASVKPTGEVKLRAGAVWVDPDYEVIHQERLRAARLRVFAQQASVLILASLQGHGEERTPSDLAADLAGVMQLPPEALITRVNTALRRLVASGQVIRVRPGVFRSGS